MTKRALTKVRHANGHARHANGQSQPRLHQHGPEVQRFDQLVDLPIGLSSDVRAEMARGSTASWRTPASSTTCTRRLTG